VSLLLDALKKAADDKQKALQLEQAGSDEINEISSISEQRAVTHGRAVMSRKDGISQGATDGGAIMSRKDGHDHIMAQGATDGGAINEPKGANDKTRASDEAILATAELSLQGMDDRQDDNEELMLDEDEIYNHSHLEKGHFNDGKSIETEGLSLEKKNNGNGYSGESLSDEALSMLIYKTNREVKKGRRALVFSILIISLGVLVSGGMFYYKDMQEEIRLLERKHQIAMQAMRSKTSDETLPVKSEIIRNLVSDVDLEEKVLLAKQQLIAEQSITQAATQATNQAANSVVSQATSTQKQQADSHTDTIAKNKLASDKAATPIVSASKATASAVSIQKTKKADPVGEQLDTAWLAYENARYGEAATLYQSVLLLEENNRDALLGLAAIAVIEKNHQLAQNIYLTLLELDPRDSIAIAALAALSNLPDKQASLADKEYLLSVLQKNPNAHHLNFALGNIYAQQNNWKSAQQYYFNAWQHNNESADYVFNLAVSLDQLGKQQQAVKFYEASLLKSKNNQSSFSREAVKKRINELSGLLAGKSSQ
jgi:tetratricopeptide (TPR) repeat protein